MKTPWLFLLTFALVFYFTGAAFIESFVNYPSWRHIGASDFVAYHHSLSVGVVAFLVAPGLLGALGTVLMLWRRPVEIPRWSVWVAIGLQATIWVSTALIQIPMQMEFSSSGFSEQRLSSLIVSNFWLRRIPGLIMVTLFVWMMHRVIAMSREQRVAARPAPRAYKVVS